MRVVIVPLLGSALSLQVASPRRRRRSRPMNDQESSARVGRQRPPLWRESAITGVVVAALLVGIVVLERFDAARDTASAVRTAAGDGAAQEAGPSLTVAWLVATAVAVVVAIFVAIGLVRAAARKGAAE